MNSPRSQLWYALALSFVPSIASAAEPSLADWARNRVEAGLVKPLAQAEARRSRFSRERPPPAERRVRVLETQLTLDKRERGFVPFVIDVRYGSDWHDDVAGCVYQGSGEIFVKSGDAYRPAAFLLGKNVAPIAGVCAAAPPRA